MSESIRNLTAVLQEVAQRERDGTPARDLRSICIKLSDIRIDPGVLQFIEQRSEHIERSRLADAKVG